MMRVKVVNDSIDLIPLLRAFEDEVRKNVFNEILNDWKTTSEIKERYGEKGVEALEFFDKIKLVETKWTTPDPTTGEKPDKMYRSYYSAFNINISCPVNEMSEIFTIASLDCDKFKKIEKEIYEYIGENGKFGNDVAEHFEITTLALKSIVKRSDKLIFRGLRVERLK
jgi:predicted DNA-binding ArsR family transcriptional regulator